MCSSGALRPGRFDRQIVVSNPDIVGRERILKVHVRKVPLAPDVELKTVARGTPGFPAPSYESRQRGSLACGPPRQARRHHVRVRDSKDKIMMARSGARWS